MKLKLVHNECEGIDLKCSITDLHERFTRVSKMKIKY